MNRPLLYALPGNEDMAALLSGKVGCQRGKIHIRRFPDGETYLRYDTLPANCSVAVLCTLNRPDEKVMSIILAASTARKLGAVRVGLIAPYLAYMRQDTSFEPGEAVSAQSFAQLLSAHFDWIATVEPHLHRIRGLHEIFSCQSASISVMPLLADWICREVRNPIVIGPDSESRQWVGAIAEAGGLPFLTLNKVRHGDRKVQIEEADLSQCRGHQPLLVDDIISTATTMIESIKYLKANGLASPLCLSVHALFAGQAYTRLIEAGARQVVTTNTVQHPTNGIDVSAMIASAVRSLL